MNKINIIKQKFKGKAKFRRVGSDRSGYKLVISDTSNKTYNKLKSMEKILERIFDVEIVNFI